MKQVLRSRRRIESFTAVSLCDDNDNEEKHTKTWSATVIVDGQDVVMRFYFALEDITTSFRTCYVASHWKQGNFISIAN